jgi:type I restriction enzyme S subunit
LGRFSALPILWRPIEEQRAIVAHVSQTNAPLDIIITHVEREIGILREYRTRLISAAVTGQLDVREAARHLPDEAEEPITMEASNGDVESEFELDDIVEEAEA